MRTFYNRSKGGHLYHRREVFANGESSADSLCGITPKEWSDDRAVNPNPVYCCERCDAIAWRNAR